MPRKQGARGPAPSGGRAKERKAPASGGAGDRRQPYYEGYFGTEEEEGVEREREAPGPERDAEEPDPA